MASGRYPEEGSGGLSTVTTAAPATGDGSGGSPVTVVASTTSVPGSMSAADKTKLNKIYRPLQGTALTDADQTLQPAAVTSEYVQPDILSANRAKTLGTTNVPTGMLVRIVRLDDSNKTLAIINGGGAAGTLFTFAASPTNIEAATFFFNGVDWVLSGFEALLVS